MSRACQAGDIENRSVLDDGLRSNSQCAIEGFVPSPGPDTGEMTQEKDEGDGGQVGGPRCTEELADLNRPCSGAR